jgi:outer membrane lipoprotein SlyB
MRLLKLSVVASVLAAGCAHVSPPDNTYAFRPGTGTVQNVQPARVAIPGGTAPKTPLQQMVAPHWMEGYQLSLRMDDGTVQAITQDSDAFHVGDRIQVTPEGRVLKAAGPAPSAPLALRPGNGTVQSVASTSVPSAAAGGSTPAQQLTLRMDDGSTQVLMFHGAVMQPGDRLSVASDGTVRRQ